MVVAGLPLGWPLAVGAGRLISTQVYGVSSWGALTLMAASAALTICFSLEAMIPADRAAKRVEELGQGPSRERHPGLGYSRLP